MGLFEYLSGIATNSANARAAEENRSWLTMMSNTAHQREVRDLRKAGLNPILTATGGPGASTPASSAAVVENPLKGANTFADIMSAKQYKLQEKSINMENSKKAAEIHNIDQDTSNKIIQGGVLNEQISNMQADTRLKDTMELKAYAETQLTNKDLSWSDRRYYAEIVSKLKGAEAQLIGARASQVSSSANMLNAHLNEKYRPWELGPGYIRSIGGAISDFLPKNQIKKVGETVESFTRKGRTSKTTSYHYSK